MVNIRNLNFESIKSVIITKMELSTSQKRTHITHKIYNGSNDNPMPFRMFKVLFLQSTIAELYATKITQPHYKHIINQTYNT